MKNNYKEKRIISKIFSRLFFIYEKDIAVIKNKKDSSIGFYFTVKNSYSNSKRRDFSLIYKKKTKRFVLYSRGGKKLYSSDYLNEVLYYLNTL